MIIQSLVAFAAKTPNAVRTYYTDDEFGRNGFPTILYIYDDWITIGRPIEDERVIMKYKYVRTINGYRKYRHVNSLGGSYYLVDNNYNVRYFLESPYFNLPDTEVGMRLDNSSSYNSSTNNMRSNSTNYNGGHRGSSKSNTNSRQKTVKHNCARCNGKGRVEYDTYPSSYGMDNNYKVKCNECGRYFLKSTGHTHISCPQCGGKGYWISK